METYFPDEKGRPSSCTGKPFPVASPTTAQLNRGNGPMTSAGRQLVKMRRSIHIICTLVPIRCYKASGNATTGSGQRRNWGSRGEHGLPLGKADRKMTAWLKRFPLRLTIKGHGNRRVAGPACKYGICRLANR